MRVVCAGHVNWDVTLRVDQLPRPDGEARIVERHQSGGGSAANAASVLSTLAVSTAVVGSVGTDHDGRQARRELVDAGVDVSHLVETGVGTATKYLVVDPDGRVMVLGQDRGNEAFHADDLPRDALGSAEVLHLTGQRPATAAELATAARGDGVPVSVDPGRRVGERGFEEVLARADLLFLTDREARAVGFDPDDPTDRPADRVVVVKHGPEGAEVRTPRETIDHPGYDVDPVDTTGSGDAFAAGFLAALLDPWDPRPAGRPEGSGEGVDDPEDAEAGSDGNDGTGNDGGADGGGPGRSALDDDRPAADYERALAVANACGALGARRAGARVQLTRGDVERFLGDR